MTQLSRLLTAGVLLSSLAPSVFAAEGVMSMPGNAVEYVQSERIVPAFADGDFEENRVVSRVDFAVWIVDAYYPEENFDGCFMDIAPSLPPRFTHLFSDVQTQDWFAKHLCVGMQAGVINGDADGAFRPYAGITVAEASTMLARAYGLTYPSQNPSSRPWYAASMQALQEKKALPPNAVPTRMLTRADVAHMLYALRDQERFPIRRVIGAKLPAVATATPTAAVAPSTTTSVLIRKRGEVSEHAETIVIKDIETVALTRRGAERISRRTLLERTRNQWK